MTDEELNQLAEQLWKRMEPFARVELERLFTNYMSTRTLLEPELVKHLFDAMGKDLSKFVHSAISTYRNNEQFEQLKRQADFEKWDKGMRASIAPIPKHPGPKKEWPGGGQ